MSHGFAHMTAAGGMGRETSFDSFSYVEQWTHEGHRMDCAIGLTMSPESPDGKYKPRRVMVDRKTPI